MWRKGAQLSRSSHELNLNTIEMHTRARSCIEVYSIHYLCTPTFTDIYWIILDRIYII